MIHQFFVEGKKKAKQTRGVRTLESTNKKNWFIFELESLRCVSFTQLKNHNQNGFYQRKFCLD